MYAGVGLLCSFAGLLIVLGFLMAPPILKKKLTARRNLAAENDASTSTEAGDFRSDEHERRFHNNVFHRREVKEKGIKLKNEEFLEIQ